MKVKHIYITGCVGYCVGNDGSIWSKRKPGRGVGFYPNWHRINPTISSNGYLTVFIAGLGYRTVHELVLQAFIGPRPEGFQARHLDGDRLNNRLDNLRWGAPKENAADRVKHGTLAIGSRNGRAKLRESDIGTIDRLRAAGCTYGAIGSALGVSGDTIRSVVIGETWSHIPRLATTLSGAI